MSAERFELIASLVGGAGSVLDVGCRDKALRDHLPERVRYVGLDLQPPADLIASAADPLPFEDRAFGCVVLADVLEHLDDPHSALDEALRVGESVVVLLPNIYTLMMRLAFLRGSLGPKYTLRTDYRVDRHRWVMSYSEAREFTRHRASLGGFRVEREVAFRYPFRRRSVRALHAVAWRVTGPDVWAWEYAARLGPL